MAIEEGGGWGGKLHSTLHCSLHHLEYRNVDGFSLIIKVVLWSLIFRMKCEFNILRNAFLYYAKMVTFMTFQDMEICIDWAS
jgi:hypothetical protein